MRQVVLDTETTGLDPQLGHSIIEIAAFELVNRCPTARQYHSYLQPLCAIDQEALAVHGITADFLKDKPIFSDIAEELLDFLSGAQLVIHNAPFDVGFLDAELARLDPNFKPITTFCTVLDTLVLARKKHPGQANSLDALCKRYKIDNSARNLHGARMDTHLLMQVYLAMTAGQISLFGESAESVHDQKASCQPLENAHKAMDFCVIKATQAELDAHSALLKSIDAIWPEDDL